MLATETASVIAPRQPLALANGLKWLVPEIDASLHRARVVIDQQQEDAPALLDVTVVSSEFRLVLGALRMAGCHGGAILAEELCITIDAVATGTLVEPGAALAAVSGATLQLSDYLDAVCHSAPDRAAVLQPAISELCLSSGRVAITEADLFVRQMLLVNARLPAGQGSDTAPAASVVAAKLLPAFQTLLLQWLKGVDVANTLVKLRKVGDHLTTHAIRPELVLLWSAFAAAIDSLITTPGAESLDLKRWVGRMGQQIKMLADHGETAAAVLAPEIAWRLLAHSAVIHHGGSRWLTLRHYLPLDSTLPIEPALSAARRHLRGPNTRLLEKVAEEVRVDLALVKDGLDLALRAGGLTPDAQALTAERLKRIANTLLLLGLPQLEQVMRLQAGEMTGLSSGESDDEGQWMRTATALLRVEHSLESALFRPLRQMKTEPQKDLPAELIETVPHSQDLRESINALLREMLVDLAKLKAQLDAFLKGAALRDADEPLQLLSEVTSGLKILDQLPAATQLGRLRDWLRQSGTETLRADPALAVCFAESVAALEIYLEALRDQLPEPERMLETLTSALQSFLPDAADELPSFSLDDALLPSEPGSDDAVPDITLQPLQPMPESLPELPTLPTAETIAGAELALAAAAFDAGIDAPVEFMPVVNVMPAPAPAPAPTAAAGDDDPEIREIFIEEAQEVFDALKRQLPVFHRDPGEPDGLGDIRRAFHTLKGSGRMVGAVQIGEFGWAIEHLLNRCIEGSLPVNRAVVAIVDSAVATLPALLQGFRQGSDSTPNDAAQSLVARAHFLASGRAPEMVERDVLEVFRADALDRLGDLQRWLDDPTQMGVDPDAVRALHTIKGSASVVNAEPLSQLAAALEGMLKQLVAADVNAPPEVRALFAEVLPVLRDWVQKAGDTLPPDAADWLARVDAFKSFLPPPGETKSLARRDALVNAAFDRLQVVEQRLVAWSATPAEPSLGGEMSDAAEALMAVVQECLPLARGAEAMTERLRAEDIRGSVPDAAFFLALGNALEHFYQFLDAYREGGVRDSGRELAELLRRLPLGAPLAWQVEQAVLRAEPAFDAAFESTFDSAVEPRLQPAEEFYPQPAEELLDAPAFFNEPAAPAFEPFAPEPIQQLEPLELHVIPHRVPLPPEHVEHELAGIFIEEAREILALLHDAVPAWQPPAAPDMAIERALHTLTGSARMVGYHALGALAHGFEQRLHGLEPGAARAQLIRDELLATLPVFDDAIDGLAMMMPPPDAADSFAAPYQSFESNPEQIIVPARAPEMSWPAASDDALFNDMVSEDASVGRLLDDGIDVEDNGFSVESAPHSGDWQPSNNAIEPPAVTLLQPLPSLIDSMEQQWPDHGRSRLLGDDTFTQVPPDAVRHEDIDAELTGIFTAEAAEMLETIATSLADWRRDAGDPSAIGELLRALHTLKGGARMTGFMQMGDVTHEMESRVSALLTLGSAPTASDHAELRADLETLEHLHDALARGEHAEPVRFVEPLQPMAGANEVEFDTVSEDAPALPPAVVVEPIGEGWEPALFWRPVQDLNVGAARRELARVPVETLDLMLNEAGEISIYRSRLEQRNAELVAQLAEMRQTVVRLREQLRLMDAETDAQIAARGLNAQGDNTPDRYEQDFDPLEMDRYSRMQELSRALSEAVGDLSSLHLSMDQGVNEAQALLLQQGRINTGVQQGLMGTLMVPFSRQVGRLQRVVRQTAQEQGKLADVQFQGVESELDRNVLERMTAPLEHLLRNAVVHGLEDPQGRQAAEKPATGTVTVQLKREGTQLVMEISDDGRGLDLYAIRNKAVERGLLPIGAVLRDDEIARFIFEPGFSTAETLTQIAGRGVGMDVVASEVKQLGGTLELHSDAGQGTRFTIRLPLTLALSQALMVRVGEEIYALPLVAIEGIGRVPRQSALTAAGGGEADFTYGAHDYRVRHLAELIDLPQVVPEDTRTVPAVLVRLVEGIAGGERRAALIVDQLLGNREVVSKAVGPQLSSISGVSGATILPSGEVVLILDPADLLIDRARRRLIAEAIASRAAIERQSATQGGRLVMVVDDSVTMRRVAERLLQRQGYRVITAKDGLDAIAQLQSETPAAILLDIEMPRADGFEVAGFVRNNERIRDTPIIMITSRSGDKHRTRAASLGVNRYLIKPYQEEQLLHELRMLLQAREAESA